MSLKIKYFIVDALEKYRLHHPYWYIGYTNCGMAELSYHLDKKWNVGLWKHSDTNNEF